MLRIGLNGFGRIGRAITRILAQKSEFQLAAVNELDSDLKNFAYLLKYDSVYGRFQMPIEADVETRTLHIGSMPVAFYSHGKIQDVPWERHEIDVLIEATGVDANAEAAHDLVRRGVPKVVITNAHQAVDSTIIIGINEASYDPDKHHVVSSSICDANAIVPVLHHVHRRWGIDSGCITTLHPWLSYQNLLDGSVKSVASPGHTWYDYGLGRSSTLSLIPKDTTAVVATLAVLPELRGRLGAISFRVPTHIVSASDMSLVLQSDASVEAINDHFASLARQLPSVFGFQTDHLVSIDYLGTEQTCIVDGGWTRVINGRLAKIVTWYDNEWGYSNRVLDVAQLIAGNHRPAAL